MVPLKSIIEWREKCPWVSSRRIEQDLILSRILVELYSDPFLKKKLVLRGGAALYKLFVNPPARYIETIEVVQIEPGALGPYVYAIRKTLDPWLGQSSWKIKSEGITAYYCFKPEESFTKTMQIKINIHTQDHFSHFDVIDINYGIESSWFSNKASIKTFCLEELLGAKLRALYQRKKGRDLFDLYTIKNLFPGLIFDKVIKSFPKFMNYGHLPISRSEFEEELFKKLKDPHFKKDIMHLLSEELRLRYDFRKSVETVFQHYISRLPAAPRNEAIKYEQG
jgi:predicted nucleotidyltransferase component of viral defense system